MKRFYRDVTVEPVANGWQVALDGRRVKTQGGAPQIVPTRALADALATEWAGQGEQIDPGSFFLRDLADHAIDADRAAVLAALLGYAETDTLCYRAEPDEPLAARQRAVWEPLLAAAEARHGVTFTRIAGVIHRPQPHETVARLRAVLAGLDPFALAALNTLSSLAASLIIGLAALEPGADATALWAAANLEEDWQREQWGEDAEATALRERRLTTFAKALDFARLAAARE